MANRTPAEVFPPGEFVKDELEERGWSQLDLAEIISKSARLVSEVISGKRSITPETARALADAFDTSPQLWMNLESAYKLSLVEADADNAISRRARLYTYPVREMVKRGWIDGSTNLDVLEHQLVSFFETGSITKLSDFAHAARKSDNSELTPVQTAWFFRARHLAGAMQTPPYSEKKLRQALEILLTLRHEPEEIREVARIISESGVRFLVVEALPGAKIDGVCFWLDESPVIAMSLRLDRIDNFWFVLRHEIEHVLGKHGMIIDTELEGDRASPDSNDISLQERQANKAGAEFCIPKEELGDFISRVGPLYSAESIIRFAGRIGVHPGLVVGQLHNRKQLPYSHLRKMLVKVRHIVTETTLNDGWGMAPQIAPLGA